MWWAGSSRSPGLEPTYEGLKLPAAGRREVWPVRSSLEPTYEGLKQSSQCPPDVSIRGARLEPTYEGLKPWYDAENPETFGAVWSLPMRD